MSTDLDSGIQKFSRRGFLGSTASAIGVVALGETANIAAAAAAGQNEPAEPPLEPKDKGIRIGMLTAPFGDKPLVEVLDFAQKTGIPCLEVVG